MNNATRVLAIRHGETAWNVGAKIQGHLDIPLNDTGRWQAERMAATVADDAIDVIYSSDLLRASQTAEPIARLCQLPLTTDAGLRERCFGVFQGMTFPEIEARWPEEARRWSKRDPDFGPDGGGESLTVFYDRCVGAATRLVAAHPGQTVVLVAHGGVMDCLYRAATRVDLRAPRSWQLSNASINRLLYTPEGFTLVGWNDTGHLDVAPRDEPSGDAGPNPIVSLSRIQPA